MFDLNACLNETEELMQLAVMHLEEEYAHIRAGKANIRILDPLRVDSYGQQVPISGVAQLSTPDPRCIAIKPWDKNMIRVIEKAIIDSSIGIMPSNNGEVIRLVIPPLTEDRRKELVKQCNKVNETTKVSIRNSRRDAIDKMKKAEKDGLAEDARKDGEDKLQKLHDKYIKQADAAYMEKEKEIMTI